MRLRRRAGRAIPGLVRPHSLAGAPASGLEEYWRTTGEYVATSVTSLSDDCESVQAVAQEADDSTWATSGQFVVAIDAVAKQRPC
jgi:hypothetical protein